MDHEGAKSREDEERERRRQVARARWRLLRGALLGSAAGGGRRDAAGPAAVSKRTFPGFQLFERSIVSERQEGGAKDEEEEVPDSSDRTSSAGDEEYVFIQYTARHPPSTRAISCSSAVLRQQREGVIVGRADLAGFDNTGNICVWPAEEVLAHYCLHNAELFRDKRVCEVGAGFGLAGLLVASCLPCECVLITDGNDKAVANIRASIKVNTNLRTHGFVRGDKLLWDRQRPVDERYRHFFDVVIAADCLFLQEYHEDLLHVLKQLLREGGQALVVAPRRGHTLEAFVEKAASPNARDARQEWRVDLVEEEYDSWVWKRHQELMASRHRGGEQSPQEGAGCLSPLYDPDVHYPLLLRLVRQ